MKTITLIPGDGVGPGIIDAAKKCIEVAKANVKWEEQEAGAAVIKKYNTPLPEQVLNSILKNKVALKGPIETPVGKGFRSVNVALRKSLDLYAGLRPAKSYEGLRSYYKNLDLVVIRENTEDVYAGIEFSKDSKEQKEFIQTIKDLKNIKIKEDSGISIKPISVSASKRIIDFAFQYAIKNKRKKITAIHKANIMKSSDGLFLEVARKVAKKYKEIEFEDKLVDNMCMQLIQKPELYDVLVLPNLYGDLISDLCAGLVGGLGVAPGANLNEELAVFEPVHGSTPKYVGKNIVNPTATILSAVLMLRHINEKKAADKIEKAVANVIKEGKSVTQDINKKNPVGTKEMTEAILKEIEIN